MKCGICEDTATGMLNTGEGFFVHLCGDCAIFFPNSDLQSIEKEESLMPTKEEIFQHIEHVLGEIGEDVRGFDVMETEDGIEVSELYETAQATFSIEIKFPRG